MAGHENLKRENLQIALAAILGVAGLVGVSVFMFLDTHSIRWDRMETLEEIEQLRLEMTQTEARLRGLTQRAEHLDKTHREMTASFLEHMGVGPLADAETTGAITDILASEGPPPPNPASPQVEALSDHMDSLGSYINDIYRTMLSRQEYTRAVPTLSPTTGWVSSHYGSRDSPFTGNHTTHNGIDIAAPTGTPIYATADGVIGFAGRFGGYGKYVLINHGFGIVTRYGHVSRYFVYPGQFVRRGQKIAAVGTTGRSTGAHLHYEVRVANRAVDPRPFMLDAGEKILGDLWERGEGIPRAPLPDFAPMGGDPEETEGDPEESGGDSEETEGDASSEIPPLDPKTEEAPNPSKALARTDFPTDQSQQPIHLKTITVPSLLALAAQPISDRTIEALKILFPWLIVGIALALLAWVSWRVSRRLKLEGVSHRA